MKILGTLSPILYIVVCLISVCINLTLIFVILGDHTYGPPLAGLACPIGLQPGERGDVVALVINNRGSTTKTYQVTFAEFVQPNNHSWSEVVYCGTIRQIGVSQITVATCSVEKSLSPSQTIIVTALAQGDDYYDRCGSGCGNSYQSTCKMRGNLLAEMTNKENRILTAIPLVVGLAQAFLLADLWFGAGKIEKAVLAISLALSTELSAYSLGLAYQHWLPAVMLNVILAAAVAAFVLWQRRRQVRRDPPALLS